VNRKMANREAVALREDFGDALAVADVPISFVA
jgi:hypothetical protein